MVTRSVAAPPTPWSRTLAEPTVDKSAYIHPFTHVIGDVHVGANVLIAPGTSIRADEGTPFHVGEFTNVQDGVVVHGLEQGRVIGDDNKSYSVWIGKNTSITHMALIHGPAYVGNSCFIGFRSTVFNARIGEGCIVMMHALIQDVEIPPGKYVPSGAIITNQQQADRLPDVQPGDVEFASHVVGVNQALRSGYRCAEDLSCIAQIRNETETPTSNTSQQFSIAEGGELLSTTHSSRTSLNSELINQVRQLLAQGYQIGTEHADKRRFRANAWNPCAPITATNESGVIAALEACMSDHQGEYVRLIGIDTKAKRRVLETIIQRPEGSSGPLNGGRPNRSFATSTASTSSRVYSSATPQGSLSAQTVQTVRQLLAQGYQVGTEHADKRRFRANAWNPCAPINANNESGILAALEACIAEHPGEYIRLIGIDTQAKRRVLETIIQRPDGSSGPLNGSSNHAFAGSSSSNSRAYGAATSQGSLSAETVQQVRQLLAQGYQIGTEHADKRRFRANAWHSCAPIAATNESGVLSALEECIAEHQGEYIRLIGIDTQAKRRVLEAIIQRPDGSSGSLNGKTTSASSHQQYQAAPNHAGGSYGSAPAPGNLDPNLIQEVRQLIRQGCNFGTEHADKRRFRANAWNVGAPITGNRELEVLSALADAMAEHRGKYVRLVGVDPKAKRRVLETVIQRP